MAEAEQKEKIIEEPTKEVKTDDKTQDVKDETQEEKPDEKGKEKEDIVKKTETKLEEELDKGDDTKGEDGDKPLDRVVPEADGYELPEGVPSEIGKFANETDLTQDQLTSVLTHFGSITGAANKAAFDTMKIEGDAHIEKWGSQKDYNLSLVRRALKQNDPDGTLTELLNSTGYGNSPPVVDFFLSIGKSMQEGGFLRGSINKPKQKGSTAASAMFGDKHPVKG